MTHNMRRIMWHGHMISLRAWGVLDRLGLREVEDIAQTRELDVMKLKNAGKKTLLELRELACALGTSFADPIDYNCPRVLRCDTPGCVRKAGHGYPCFGKSQTQLVPMLKVRRLAEKRVKVNG